LNDPVDPTNPGCLVCDVLKEKHLPAQLLVHDYLVMNESVSSPSHLWCFDALSGSVIQSAVLWSLGAPLQC